MSDESFSHRASAALLGAFVGDSMGSLLEFTPSASPAKVELALTMPGGGPHQVAPGQITDDGELTLALCHALRRKDPRAGFPAEAAMEQYRDWFKSFPFDIGGTCRAAFGQDPPALNYDSIANGALMRSSPLAIWAHPSKTGKDMDWTFDMAAADAALSHPHPTAQNANGAYIVAMAHSLSHPDDSVGAWTAAKNTLKSRGKGDTTDAAQWLEDARTGNLGFETCRQNMGFARYAFVLAFYHLLLGSSFEDAMKDVLRRGGDTDTNACIVGALVAAAGREIPPEMVAKVRGYTTSGRTARADKWAAKAVRDVTDDPEGYFEGRGGVRVGSY